MSPVAYLVYLENHINLQWPSSSDLQANQGIGQMQCSLSKCQPCHSCYLFFQTVSLFRSPLFSLNKIAKKHGKQLCNLFRCSRWHWRGVRMPRIIGTGNRRPVKRYMYSESSTNGQLPWANKYCRRLIFLDLTRIIHSLERKYKF